MSLAAVDATLRIGSATLVREATLKARPGEVLGMLGPNGAGKSSLLALLAGDRRPSAGSVRLHGRDIADWPVEALARVRAVTTQSASVAFDYTAREVVELARFPHAGRSLAQDDRHIVAQALEMADVAHLAGRLWPGLSGGERQRVQAARAFAQIWTATDDAPARYLLLDEPTSSLDLRHQHALLGAVRRFVADGVGAIVVLHDINLAAAYCDRVALLDGGRLVACGPTRAVLAVDDLAGIYGVSLAAVDTGIGPPHFVVRTPSGDVTPPA
jgi:iron complex transport system ATP-binding protein